MSEIDKELKIYGQQGLRTAADWLTRGRELKPDQSARSDVKFRGQDVSLFSRDQTNLRAPSTRH